jgi:uncharacterized membrane protein YdjX (TVP38/TMEM64 family)
MIENNSPNQSEELKVEQVEVEIGSTNGRDQSSEDSEAEPAGGGDGGGSTDPQDEGSETGSANSTNPTNDGFCNLRLRNYLLPISIGLILLGLIIYIIVDSVTTGNVRRGLESFLAWIQANPGAGTVSFMLMYAVATVIFVPGSLLTLGAGFVFSATFGLGLGIFLGTLVVFVGACAGAMVSFLLARYLLRKQVEKLSKKYAIFEAIDTAIRENGFKIFVLLRLSPLIPYNVFNYIGGVTAVSFRSYCFALIGILPGTVLYVFLGASAGSLTESAMSGTDPTVTIIVLVLGLVPSVAAVWLTARYAKRELNRTIEARRSRQEETDGDGEGDGVSVRSVVASDCL